MAGNYFNPVAGFGAGQHYSSSIAWCNHYPIHLGFFAQPLMLPGN